MRTEINQWELNKWLKPTATQYTREFSRCFYSIGRKSFEFKFKNSQQNGPKYEEMGEILKTASKLRQ